MCAVSVSVMTRDKPQTRATVYQVKSEVRRPQVRRHRLPALRVGRADAEPVQAAPNRAVQRPARAGVLLPARCGSCISCTVTLTLNPSPALYPKGILEPAQCATP